MTLTAGFAPIVAPCARVLILGTLPSLKSLETHQYYGHPQNAFWKIMGELFGAGPEVSYSDRKEIITRNRVAIWDVLDSSVRPGSMDSAIEVSSAVANDFVSFFGEQPEIGLVCFNGKSAARLFEQLVAPTLEKSSNKHEYRTLPSTSPAYASMSFEEKLERWKLVQVAANKKKGDLNDRLRNTRHEQVR